MIQNNLTKLKEEFLNFDEKESFTRFAILQIIEKYEKTDVMENKELETWLKETKAKNLSLEELEKHIVGHLTCPEYLYISLRNKFKLKGGESLVDYLFNQWQKEAEFSPKIIGYKAPFDLFNGVIKKGHLFIEWTRKHYYSAVNENVSNYSLPKEIVETWEPEFEPLPTEQPTETDFKSKVIELIKENIKEYEFCERECLEMLETYSANELRAVRINMKNLLRKIKQLC